MSPSAIARDSVGIFALRILLYAATFLTGVVVSRALGPTGRGEYYLPYLGAVTLVTVAKLGIDNGALVLYGQGRYGLGPLWHIVRRVSWAGGVVGIALLVASPWLLPSVYRDAATGMLLLAAVTIPLQMETLLGGGLLLLAGNALVQFRGALLGVLLQAALLAVLWAVPGLSPTLVLVSGLAGALATWSVIVRHCNRFPHGSVPRHWLRDVLAASLPLHVSSMLLWLHLRVDMFMVSAIGGVAMVGLYSLAVMLAETVQMATDAVGTALTPRQATGQLQDAAHLALLGARVNTIIGGLVALGWALVAPVAVPLVFGRSFQEAVPPLLFLLPGMVVFGWQRSCGTAIVRAGQPWRIVAIHGASLVLNAALNVWLIPRYGASGSAIASSASYLLSAVALLTWTVRLAQASPGDVFPKVADVALLSRGLLRLLSRSAALPGESERSTS